MKKILLLLFLLYSIVFSAVEDRKTDVYFANGILTEEEDAETNAKLLDVEIEDKFGMAYYNQRINKVTYAYNSTHAHGVLDGIETMYQKYGLQWLNELFIPYYARDLDKQIEDYKKSISQGHGVLVVAHSQGNFFTKEAYDALSPCMQA